jgi:hypothetical protein
MWLRAGLGVGGLVAVGALIHHLGGRAVWASLGPALRWLPVVAAIELGRISSETLATRIALGNAASRVPLGALFRATLVGYSIGSLAPAPRVVNEAIKVSVLGPRIGMPEATSVGLTMQAATLISVGVFSIPCGLAMYALGQASLWFWAASVHALVLVASGVGLRAATRARGPGRWLARRFPRLGRGADAFADHAQGAGLFALGPSAALMGNRTSQVLQIGVAAHAVGIDVDVVRALAAEGVNLIANAVGVFVPGSLGATDGAFALAADMLGTTAARAAALALLLRCSQVVWLAIGSLTILVSRRSDSESPRQQRSLD